MWTSRYVVQEPTPLTANFFENLHPDDFLIIYWRRIVHTPSLMANKVVELFDLKWLLFLINLPDYNDVTVIL